MHYTKPSLLTPARSLTTAFASGAPIPTLLTHFTRDPYPTAHEHGLPGLAPFLGRTFTGVDGVSRYFEVLGDNLGVERMDFEDEEMWVVDVEKLVVVLRGEARFFSRRTGQAWWERFVYRLGMAEDLGGDDEDGVEGWGGSASGGAGGTYAARRGGLKVQEYLVWADTAAAYLARQGRLGEVDGGGETTTSGNGKGETRSGIDRKMSGCGETVGSGMNAYGSCGQ